MRYLLLALVCSTALILDTSFSDAKADDASFRCSKAQTPVELRICNSPYVTLKKVDRDLAKWYKRALSEVSDRNQLIAEQREWLTSLDSCLISGTPEPAQFVCDYAQDKTQCARDFCIFRKYSDRIKALYGMPIKEKAGQYVISNQWPNGIHENVDTMEEEDRPLCQHVESTIRAYGPLAMPLTEQNLFEYADNKIQVTWKPIPKDKLFDVALTLEKVLRSGGNPQTELLESESFKKLINDRLSSGEITIEQASEPILVHATVNKEERKETSVLRYQRWANHTKTTNMDYLQRVEFFRLDSTDISKAQPIIKSATNTFLFDGHIYFASLSERGYDDNWEMLPIHQPELFLYKVQWYDSMHTMFKTACHLLFVPKKH